MWQDVGRGLFLCSIFLERSFTNHWINPSPEDKVIHITNHSKHPWCFFNLFLSSQYDNRTFYTTGKIKVMVWIASCLNKNHSLDFLVWTIICASQVEKKNLLTLFLLLPWCYQKYKEFSFKDKPPTQEKTHLKQNLTGNGDFFQYLLSVHFLYLYFHFTFLMKIRN